MGRWSPEGSDQYVRSYNAVITRLQRVFAMAVRRGDAYKRLDEGAVLEDLKIWLVEKWRMDKEGAIRAVDNWKSKIKLGPMDDGWGRLGRFGVPHGGGIQFGGYPVRHSTSYNHG